MRIRFSNGHFLILFVVLVAVMTHLLLRGRTSVEYEEASRLLGSLHDNIVDELGLAGASMGTEIHDSTREHEADSLENRSTALPNREGMSTRLRESSPNRRVAFNFAKYQQSRERFHEYFGRLTPGEAQLLAREMNRIMEDLQERFFDDYIHAGPERKQYLVDVVIDLRQWVEQRDPDAIFEPDNDHSFLLRDGRDSENENRHAKCYLDDSSPELRAKQIRFAEHVKQRYRERGKREQKRIE